MIAEGGKQELAEDMTLVVDSRSEWFGVVWSGLA